MIFLYLGIILLVIAIVLKTIIGTYEAHEIVFVIGIVFLLICFIGFIKKNLNEEYNLKAYEIEKEFIESIDKKSSGEEKKFAMEIALKDNLIIETHKMYFNNLFIGVFYSEKIANLEKLSTNF